MYLVLVFIATVALVLYSNRKGWYSFSEYLACFGFGMMLGIALNYAGV